MSGLRFGDAVAVNAPDVSGCAASPGAGDEGTVNEAYESTTAPVLAIGTELMGGWRVVRLLSDVSGQEAVLVEDDAFGRAICFVLPADAPDPAIDDASASRWGTNRRLLRDEVYGRILLDEVPDGPLLADRLAEGWSPTQAWFEELGTRVREQHRAEGWHGQLAPDRIVIGQEGLAVAGWGLGAGDAADLRARDLAALGAVAGMAGKTAVPAPPRPVETPETVAGPSTLDFDLEPGESAPAGPPPPPGAPDTTALRAAISADHLPHLREAIESWRAGGGSEHLPDFVRARDALERLERRVADQLDGARRMLERGDPLGAVAACREVIRLGAEEEAGPLLKQARRQAKQMLSRGRLPSLRQLGIGAAGLAVVLLLLLGLWSVLPDSAEGERLVTTVEELAAAEGERKAVNLLLGLRTRNEASDELEQLLSEHYAAMVDGERQRLVDLRREVVARGARPRDGDALAEQALGALEALPGDPIFQSPMLASRIGQHLAELDKVAALYRADTVVREEDAVRAVELLVADDPVFVAPAGGAR